MLSIGPVVKIGAGEHVIMPMSEHDLLEVVEIEETCGLSQWGWDAYRAEMERLDSIMLIARHAKKDLLAKNSLSGFIVARLAGDEMHINNIGVLKSFRRRGIGSTLLRTAMAQGFKGGAKVAVLEVRASNEVAKLLYWRHGFNICGRRRNYYSNPSEDALMMCATLSFN